MQTPPLASIPPASTHIPRRTRASRSARIRGDSPSLGTQLERDRLEQRAARVKQVIRALRERADVRHGDPPRPLLAAIEGFGRELTDIERQLRRVGSS